MSATPSSSLATLAQGKARSAVICCINKAFAPSLDLALFESYVYEPETQTSMAGSERQSRDH